MGTEHDNEKLVKFLTENMGELRDAIGLTKGELEALYAEAYGYYQNAEYENAATAFANLTQIAHLDRRFHLGHGAALQALGLYTEAIRSYMIASTLDLTDPEPSLSIGYCLVQMQQYEEAKNVLNLVIEETQDNVDQKTFHTRAHALLNKIQQLELNIHPI